MEIMQKHKIYVSIASFMDKELFLTVENMLKTASFPSRIVPSIYSQDTEHPDLEKLFKEYKVKEYFYKRVHYTESRGVGKARSETYKNLSTDYRYNLQIDSHMRFVKNWDEKIISDYEEMQKLWGTSVLTLYPPWYQISGNKEIYGKDVFLLDVVQSENEFLGFDAKYNEKRKCEKTGVDSGYFCGGFAFGLTDYFLKVPYDPNIFFNGEEQTMSLRFFQERIKLIANQEVYVYHDYEGTNRKRPWEKLKNQSELEQTSFQRVYDIINNKISDEYSLKNSFIYPIWKIAYQTEI